MTCAMSLFAEILLNSVEIFGMHDHTHSHASSKMCGDYYKWQQKYHCHMRYMHKPDIVVLYLHRVHMEVCLLWMVPLTLLLQIEKYECLLIIRCKMWFVVARISSLFFTLFPARFFCSTAMARLHCFQHSWTTTTKTTTTTNTMTFIKCAIWTSPTHDTSTNYGRATRRSREFSWVRILAIA